MAKTATINPRIVESLYGEALVLSDEVREAFNLSAQGDLPHETEDLVRVAVSSEGLRTTTRMMHAISWLLNHRAFFMGELSEFQLRRHGRLAPDLAHSDPQHLVLLRQDMRELVARTERFYARLARLDETWRQPIPGTVSAIDSLRERLMHQAAH